MSSETVAMISAGIALLAAAGAWAAVLVNRRNATDTIRAQVNIGARNSRAAVVSANRQKWIDAIRDDVAEFSATRSQLAVVESRLHQGGFVPGGTDLLETEIRQSTAKLHMLRSRVEMRLNFSEPEHDALMSAMDRYWKSRMHKDDLAMRIAARTIFKAEWERLKKEASGIDPFVRETKVPATTPVRRTQDAAQPSENGEAD